MRNEHLERTGKCQICGSTHGPDLRPGILAGPAVGNLIREETGNWSENDLICLDDLAKFRHKYVEGLLEAEKGELGALEVEVLESLKQQDIFSHNPEPELRSSLTFGQRLADRIASFGGSWAFIITFGAVILAWVVLNTVILITRPFDPYPFIFLNLILSTLAAIQAPVIMMSQIRQEDRDRLHMSHDYQVNLKAELEIRHLNQKVDHLMTSQWERMIEIQEMQMELMNEIRNRT